MKTLETDLKSNISGEVRFDTIARAVYSVDASIYEIEPIGIVLPKNKQELIRTVQIARKWKTPLIARGAATGIAGGCIGKGLVVDCSKYLNRILEINYDQEYVICEPGVIQDQLNAALDLQGYRLGPDTSTGNRATIGGMAANNAAGARSLCYGKMSDHIQSVELILSTGEVVIIEETDEETLLQKCKLGNSEGRIYRGLVKIRSEYRDEIQKNFPKLPRRVSGYNLDELISSGPLNASKLIAGSEGTLGIISSIKLGICKKPKNRALILIPFQDMIDAMAKIPFFLQFHLLSLEMIDDKILQAAPASSQLLEYSDKPACIFIAEVEAGTAAELKNKIEEILIKIETQGFHNIKIVQDEKGMDHIWEVRKAGLGLLLSKRSYSRAIAFIEDITIPPEKLAPFMEKFLKKLESSNKSAGIYGHVGSGCMHIRPYVNLREPQELQWMQRFMEEVAELLLEYGGALSGEHGDGLARSWLNKKMFGERLYAAFKELKNLFDPEGLMNPGKIVDGPPLLNNLRLDPNTPIQKTSSFLDFSKEGGLELAADLCNGNAQCRKGEGLMCPSFQATRDEYHTTRARAQTLRALIHRKIGNGTDFLASEALVDVLDLCLECKGCKTECPSLVDMAKMKAEILFQYQEKNGYSLRNRFFGNMSSIFRFASPFSRFLNKLNQSSFIKKLLELFGITSKRPLPLLSPSRFSEWTYQQPIASDSKKVVLLNDSYTEFQAPEIGIAAVKLLNALGYQVIIPPWKCCGRPLISKGILKKARKKTIALIDQLYPYAKESIPIIGLEPSCLLTIVDDFQAIHPSGAAECVATCALTIDQFLYKLLKDGRFSLPYSPQKKRILVHTHCHQKSLIGSLPTLEVLKSIPEFSVEEIHSGCCGLAGSFGFEKEHYDISLKIGGLSLFPAIVASPPDTVVIANGISCRSQIAHGTGKKAMHLVELLAQSLSNC